MGVKKMTAKTKRVNLPRLFDAILWLLLFMVPETDQIRSGIMVPETDQIRCGIMAPETDQIRSGIMVPETDQTRSGIMDPGTDQYRHYPLQMWRSTHVFSISRTRIGRYHYGTTNGNTFARSLKIRVNEETGNSSSASMQHERRVSLGKAFCGHYATHAIPLFLPSELSLMCYVGDPLAALFGTERNRMRNAALMGSYVDRLD